jgi:predicted site-specific integrase-resolvase
MENIAVNAPAPEETGLLDGWLNRAELAHELAISVDTLQRWETRRIGPPCVRVGRKVLYRKDAVREWLCEQEARKTGAHRAVAGRR